MRSRHVGEVRCGGSKPRRSPTTAVQVHRARPCRRTPRRPASTGRPGRAAPGGQPDGAEEHAQVRLGGGAALQADAQALAYGEETPSAPTRWRARMVRSAPGASTMITCGPRHRGRRPCGTTRPGHERGQRDRCPDRVAKHLLHHGLGDLLTALRLRAVAAGLPAGRRWRKRVSSCPTSEGREHDVSPSTRPRAARQRRSSSASPSLRRWVMVRALVVFARGCSQSSSSRGSTTTVVMPRAAKSAARNNPLGPPPATSTSTSAGTLVRTVVWLMISPPPRPGPRRPAQRCPRPARRQNGGGWPP